MVSREPGVYEGVPHAVYHAETDSLSSTGARKLIDPSCPALFKHWLENPDPPKLVFDLGNAAHDTLLGGGPEIVTLDYPDWRTKEARTVAEDVRKRGAVPILREQREQIDAMVTSIRSHPFAGNLFDPDNGQPEVSLFWDDEQTGVHRRARLDWLPRRFGRRLIVPDLKTTICAQRDAFAKSAMNYGYHAQASYYLDGVKALDIAADAALVFVAVEKAPPYLVNVIQLDVAAMRIGASLNRQAIDTYARCSAEDRWPSYSDDIELASLPVWYERRFEEAS